MTVTESQSLDSQLVTAVSEGQTLFHDLGVPNVKYLKKSDGVDYSSSYSAQEFLAAMSETLDKKLESDMKDSPAVAVLADEPTDISVHKRLVIYVQLLNPVTMKTCTRYLTNVQFHEGTGTAIAAEIFSQCEKRGVTCKKIMGLGSDGASVMTGKGKGVAGMMMRKNLHIINVHCVAHRLALSTSQAAENIAPLKEYQETITSIYYYFKYSPNRVASLSEIQKVLNDPQLRYKEVHSVRWLSFYNALETVHRTLDSLLTYFAETVNSKDPKAAGLKKKFCLFMD
ncbi:zinc finger protein 862-like [Ylistrum balloti]|uniref:zinc finger protein 862-like n=1 Tax=Ylistrum balloti TaxID=509963 RepID=UPI00290594DC|nr:zinc finger protein 862-like [Ylistrum balloti]